MTVSIYQISNKNVLIDSLFNFVNDLKGKGVNVSKLQTCNLTNFLNVLNEDDENVCLYVLKKDYLLVKNKLSEVSVFNGSCFVYKDKKIFLVYDSSDYYNLLDFIAKNEDVEGETIYKLYSCDYDKLKVFLESKSIQYKIENANLDFLVKLNLTKLSTEEKWEFLRKFILEFKEYIYAEANLTLQQQLVNILKMRGLKFSCAESFTGGGISSLITSVSGSSAVFYEGIVAYDSKAKHDRLNVKNDTIIEKYPVSSETCYEMCLGLLDKGVDLVVSTTGIAGPNSDESNLPVGLVYIGVGSRQKIGVYKFKFDGTRRDITCRGVETAIFMAIKALRDGTFDV